MSTVLLFMNTDKKHWLSKFDPTSIIHHAVYKYGRSISLDGYNDRKINNSYTYFHLGHGFVFFFNKPIFYRNKYYTDYFFILSS